MRCIPCKGCYTCDATDPTKCLSCFPPQTLNTTTNSCDAPIKCTNSGCRSCSDSTTCLTCFAGYSLFNNDCVACI